LKVAVEVGVGAEGHPREQGVTGEGHPAEHGAAAEGHPIKPGALLKQLAKLRLGRKFQAEGTIAAITRSFSRT